MNLFSLEKRCLRSAVLGPLEEVFSLRSTEKGIYGLNARYLRVCEKLQQEFKHADDAVQIRRFLELKEIEGLSVTRLLKYYHSLKVFYSVSGRFDCSREDVGGYLLLLRRKYKISSQETMWYCVKKFLEWLGKSELFYDLKPKFREKGLKLPEELLTVEEVNRMINAARSLRDKALVAVLYESGCRIGEIVTLQKRHIRFDEYGAVLVVNGKTGMRRVRLVESASILAEYVDSIPKVEGYIWTGPNGLICHRAAYKAIKKIAKRAKIGKNVYPHLFRHSRATHLADKLTEAQMKILFGWSGRSDVPSVYVHLSGRDVEEAILAIYRVKGDPTKM